LHEISNHTFVNRISSTYKGGKTKTQKLADAPPSLVPKNIFDTLTAFNYTLTCDNYAIADIGTIPIFLGEAYAAIYNILNEMREAYVNIYDTLNGMREAYVNIYDTLNGMREAYVNICNSLNGMRKAYVNVYTCLPEKNRHIVNSRICFPEKNRDIENIYYTLNHIFNL